MQRLKYFMRNDDDHGSKCTGSFQLVTHFLAAHYPLIFSAAVHSALIQITSKVVCYEKKVCPQTA